jgi:hypothetical protein
MFTSIFRYGHKSGSGTLELRIRIHNTDCNNNWLQCKVTDRCSKLSPYNLSLQKQLTVQVIIKKITYAWPVHSCRFPFPRCHCKKLTFDQLSLYKSSLQNYNWPVLYSRCTSRHCKNKLTCSSLSLYKSSFQKITNLFINVAAQSRHCKKNNWPVHNYRCTIRHCKK